jgi:hypothetical protein
MPDLYDIDFDNQVGDLIPPDKRTINFATLLQSLTKGLQYTHDLIFDSYKKGSTAPAYAVGVYAKYDQVIYNKAVYESLVDGNNATPTDLTKWRVIQENYIGVDERILYNGGKLILEYALNKWFDTTFLQPPLVSDIYLTTNPTLLSVFRVGYTEDESSSVGDFASSENVFNDYSFAANYGLTINIPVAVYNALGPDAATREAVVRNFADKYVITGVFYDINAY